MANITVCVRFRPLISSEKRLHDESTRIQAFDTQSFAFKDEKEEDAIFCFDRVFYQDSEQVEVCDFLATPIIEGALNAINGTILIYGQTGAGKTYTMEGPSVLDEDQKKKGLLPRVVDGLFEGMKSFGEMTKWTVKLTMVEIYMDKIRDLFDASKDNIQIKENKCQGIFLSGATEMPIKNAMEALRCFHRGISNRAVGETQMNVASSRSHSLYIFSVQQESASDVRSKIGKVVLVDLAGSEKAEKTGAGGTVLEEAKSINKSLSALGNVINALTTGKVNHIPYRDSRLTRILQDALGGNSRTALLCCCSPSPTNASESLSTLRFGARHA
ncbi:kinesin-like protein KIN-1 [Zingiber officinale]|uniref:kinesin-like protein KIN-1 n=1 Tax=Zingiber officinale TaxID=94328 RepID=UPI001C4D1C1A|nr:kinesin-like protein KIN-1 [Zingiber officinale]